MDLGFEPPILVMISLLGVKGYRTPDSFRYFTPYNSEIDRDSLVLPDIFVDEYGSDSARLLRPAFDAIWQAMGFGGSQNYDEKGNWMER